MRFISLKKCTLKYKHHVQKKIIDQLKGLRISMRGYVNQDKMENIPLISKYLVTLKNNNLDLDVDLDVNLDLDVDLDADLDGKCPNLFS